jgi:glutamate synthase domain-containing protein 3
VCGDAGDALADSMYDGVVFVGGKIASLGNDAVIEEPSSQELSWLHDLLHEYNLSSPTSFKKVVSGKKLWNFDQKEREVWKAAL